MYPDKLTPIGSGWTPARRERQSKLIREWQPWTKSTGPRTHDGKAVASKNSYKGGYRPFLRGLSRLIGTEVSAVIAQSHALSK